MGYDRLYYLKKSFALYPGIVRPVAAPFLDDHYRRRSACRGAPRAVLDALIGLGFMAWSGWRAARVARKYGLRGPWRRWATRTAWTRFVDPNDLALFRIAEAGQLDGYIRRFEDAAINKRINPLGWTRQCALADKARFHARCRQSGLPHPQTIATVGPDGAALVEDPAGRALIAKPADGEGGDGVRLLGPIADATALSLELARIGRIKGTLIVQERIAPHPDLADLALGALPTVRVVTILDEHGVPEIVSATFRFPTDPAAQVDNMKAGGLIAPVDLETGVLGLACKGYGGGDYGLHPFTGAKVVGRTLPGWPAVRVLAVHAHATAFADYTLIGWDIAMTPNGPLLIEGNGKPGVLMPQRAARRGLGEGRYGQLIAHHLATKP